MDNIPKLFKLGSRRNISEEVFDVIYQKILNGDYRLGQRLQLSQFGEDLGVSRTPILAALNRLAELGVVEILPRKGIYLIEPKAKEINDIFEIRKQLELFAIKAISKNTILPNFLEEMKNKLEQLRMFVQLNDYKNYVINDSEFHNLLIRSCGNESLLKVYGSLNLPLLIYRIRFMFPEDDIIKTQIQHEGIMEAILERKWEEAQKGMEVHLERSRRGLVDAVVKAGYEIQN